MARAAAGFLVAPMLVPLALAILLLAEGGVDPRERVGFALLGGSVFVLPIYAVALFIGVPLFRFFRSQRWNDPWRFAVAGGVLALMSLLLVTLYGEMQPGALVVLFSAGAASGSVYWAIAVRERAEPSHNP
jgi:hypothetical protein